MTQRSSIYHRNCLTVLQTRAAAQANIPGFASESGTKRLLRLLTCGDPIGGLTEAQFCSLFSRCSYCLRFMTWEVSEDHDCLVDAEVVDEDMDT